MYKVKFSVLSYYPSIVTDENINVGILFFNETTNQRSFYIMKNWKRLESFDDEIDISFMKHYLEGIKHEVIGDCFFGDGIFTIEEYTKFYVNDLRFSKIQEANLDKSELDEFILLTQKVHMRLDYKKSDRLKRDEEIKYIKSLMRANKVQYSVSPLKGSFDEPIVYDYTVGDYGFKNFTFEGKEMNRLISNAKNWAFTAMENSDRYKTVFVYDVEKKDSVRYSQIMKILSKYAYKVMNTTDVINFIFQIKHELDLNDEKETQIRIQL